MGLMAIFCVNVFPLTRRMTSTRSSVESPERPLMVMTPHLGAFGWTHFGCTMLWEHRLSMAILLATWSSIRPACTSKLVGELALVPMATRHFSFLTLSGLDGHFLWTCPHCLHLKQSGSLSFHVACPCRSAGIGVIGFRPSSSCVRGGRSVAGLLQLLVGRAGLKYGLGAVGSLSTSGLAKVKFVASLTASSPVLGSNCRTYARTGGDKTSKSLSLSRMARTSGSTLSHSVCSSSSLCHICRYVSLQGLLNWVHFFLKCALPNPWCRRSCSRTSSKSSCWTDGILAWKFWD